MERQLSVQSVPIRFLRGQIFQLRCGTILFASSIVDDALPFQLGVFEIQQQSDFKSGNVQVTEHLGEVVVIECRYNFGVDDHLALYDEIRNQFADYLAAVADGKPPLFNRVASSQKFNFQSSFVDLFRQSRSQSVQDIHRGANDALGDRFMEHPQSPAHFDYGKRGFHRSARMKEYLSVSSVAILRIRGSIRPKLPGVETAPYALSSDRQPKKP